MTCYSWPQLVNCEYFVVWKIHQRRNFWICRYSREWRYHTEEKVWITQVPGMMLAEKTSTYERGTYYFFDAQNWRKVPKEFHLDYSKLEGRPVISPNLHNTS